MVKLTRIYTRTGDRGATRLSDMSQTRKTDALVEAYGCVDEANCALGLVATEPGLPKDVLEVITHLQNELFDVGADLSYPVKDGITAEQLRVLPEYIDRLEVWCDKFAEDLPTMASFTLPGGSRLNALLHLARTIVRRAEREAWRADEITPVNPLALTYLNRLSDLLFILARHVVKDSAELLWIPGKDRQFRQI